MKTYFFPALKITFLTMILFGVIYPVAMVGIAKLIGPGGGDGQTLELNGKTIGFTLIGQTFSQEKYFNSRPSAVNYNAAATGGSNKGPNNPEYLQLVETRINDFLQKNPGISKGQIPVDLITASGGGLDPDLSPAAAMIQVKRIARTRGMKEEQIENLVLEYTERPLFGWMGVSSVNVLKINLALDQLAR